MNKKSENIKGKEITIDNRSEIEGKVSYKSRVKNTKKDTEVDLDQTIALNTVEIMRKADSKKATSKQKRSEIEGKVGNKKDEVNNKEVKTQKVKTRKIRPKDVLIKEDETDIIQENVENVSLAMIAMLVLFCVVFIFVLWYMLSKIALTNSDAIALIFRGLSF